MEKNYVIKTHEGFKGTFDVTINCLLKNEVFKVADILKDKQDIDLARVIEEKGRDVYIRVLINPEKENCNADYVGKLIDAILEEEFMYIKQSAGAEEPEIEPVLEDVRQKLIQFYEEDQENRAVFTIYVDRKKEVISGEVLGKYKLLVTGVGQNIANNKDIRRIFADASYIAATKGLAELVDILSTDKEKDHE